MWTCSVCETKNNDTDNFCACCGAPKPVSAQKPVSKPSSPPPSSDNQRPSANTQAKPSSPKAPSQGKPGGSVSSAARKVSFEEKELQNLRRQVAIPSSPETVRNNSGCNRFATVIASILLSIVGGALLTYVPVWIFGDLFVKLGKEPLLTNATMEKYSLLFILICFVLIWVYQYKLLRKTDQFQAVWNGKELICSWPTIKMDGVPALAVDGRWIALDKFVENGVWVKQGDQIAGLRCMLSEPPRKALLAEVSRAYQSGAAPGSMFKYSATYYSQVDVSRSQ